LLFLLSVVSFVSCATLHHARDAGVPYRRTIEIEKNSGVSEIVAINITEAMMKSVRQHIGQKSKLSLIVKMRKENSGMVLIRVQTDRFPDENGKITVKKKSCRFGANDNCDIDFAVSPLGIGVVYLGLEAECGYISNQCVSTVDIEELSWYLAALDQLKPLALPIHKSIETFTMTYDFNFFNRYASVVSRTDINAGNKPWPPIQIQMSRSDDVFIRLLAFSDNTEVSVVLIRHDVVDGTNITYLRPRIEPTLQNINEDTDKVLITYPKPQYPQEGGWSSGAIRLKKGTWYLHAYVKKASRFKIGVAIGKPPVYSRAATVTPALSIFFLLFVLFF